VRGAAVAAICDAAAQDPQVTHAAHAGMLPGWPACMCTKLSFRAAELAPRLAADVDWQRQHVRDLSGASMRGA
jgi:hypothetical protein